MVLQGTASPLPLGQAPVLVPSGPTPATQTVWGGLGASHCGGGAEVTGLEDRGQLRAQLTGRNWNQEVWGRARP